MRNTIMKGILEARNEIQGFGFYKRQQETRVCQSLPLRKKERTRTLWDPRTVSMEIQGHVPPPQIEDRRRLVCGTKVTLR